MMIFDHQKGTRFYSSKAYMPSGIKKLEQLIKDSKSNSGSSLGIKQVDIIGDVDILVAAYNKVKSNPNTKGSNNITQDGINWNWFDKTVSDIRTGRYHFIPTRRQDILKPKGGTRPLGIVSPRDKIVLEAMRMIQEAIFEPTFSTFSHGFRPGKSSHSAQNDIKMKFSSVHWIIEGDISKCFDTIDHKILMNIISKRIKDQIFIDLLWKALRAGYITFDKVFHSTDVGAPQGSIISPIMSNIIQHELDKWIEKQMDNFNKGTKRKANPEYTKLIRSHVSKAERTRRIAHIHRNNIRSLKGNDENFKRMYYVRYADDFLIGISGSKEDAVTIRQHLAEFLFDNQNMALSMEKTKITHFLSPVKFLGVDIKNTVFTKYPRRYIVRKGIKKLVTFKTRPQQLAPISHICNKLVANKYAKLRGKIVVPTRVGRLIHYPIYMIIDHFTSMLKGLVNYYTFTNNFTKFKARMYYQQKYSCAQTICSKMKLRTQRKTFHKFGPDLKVNLDTDVEDKFRSKSTSVINGQKDKKKKVMSFPKYESFKRKSILKLDYNYNPESIIRLLTISHPRSRKLLESSNCIVCGATNNIEMHHINSIKTMKDLIKMDYMKSLMARINRKQVPVCKPTHIQIHKGKHNGPGL